MISLLNWHKQHASHLKTLLLTGSRFGISHLERGLTREVQDATSFQGSVFWKTDMSILTSLDVRAERRGKDIVIAAFRESLRSRNMQMTMRRASAAAAYLHLAGPGVESLMFDLSDGQLPSKGVCTFSSCEPNIHLVPDFYFFRDRGHQEIRTWAQENDVPWKDRSPEIIWRGLLNGAGLFSVDPAQRDNPLVRQRLRMALHTDKTDVDFRFVGANAVIEKHLLQKAGLLGDVVPNRTWMGRKFAIDIDGFTNTFDNLFHRLLLGNCVLKVDSQMGFRQWFYDLLKPFEHYVPMKKDMSDLQEKLEWIRSHDAECQAIAMNGRLLAQSLTWDAVMDQTAADLRQFCRVST